MSSVLLNALGKYPDFQKSNFFMHAYISGKKKGKSGKGKLLGIKEKEVSADSFQGKNLTDNISNNVTIDSLKSAAGLEPEISSANSMHVYPCAGKSNFPGY